MDIIYHFLFLITKIRLSHKRKRTFINTQHYVSKRQMDEELNITDDIVNGALNKTLDTYRQPISKLGNGLFTLSCEELKNLLKDNSSNINFIKFCDDHILKLRNGNRIGTANNHRTVRNSLVDYFKVSDDYLTDIKLMLGSMLLLAME